MLCVKQYECNKDGVLLEEDHAQNSSNSEEVWTVTVCVFKFLLQ